MQCSAAAGVAFSTLVRVPFGSRDPTPRDWVCAEKAFNAYMKAAPHPLQRYMKRMIAVVNMLFLNGNGHRLCEIFGSSAVAPARKKNNQDRTWTHFYLKRALSGGRAATQSKMKAAARAASRVELKRQRAQPTGPKDSSYHESGSHKSKLAGFLHEFKSIMTCLAHSRKKGGSGQGETNSFGSYFMTRCSIQP